ncbi:MAG TPA: vitamin B12 dependent-methionine synthase activation domain-containing protein [Bacteroidales bacterium]|nr:vitamin B12 dependent-methionine synthase activation domain-containing protein [Bacteroidales bacterium]
MLTSGENVSRKIRFSFNDLGLTTADIEKIIGSKDTDGHEYMLSMVENVFREAAQIADIRAEYHIFSNIAIDEEERSIYIGDVRFNIGKIIFPHLKKSDFFTLFLCTAGAETGRRSASAMKNNDLLTGYLYDVIGTEIAEKTADLLQAELLDEAVKNGLKITNRYSPGYCGWNVEEQHKLFSFFPYNFCGIDLTPSALMNPVKSVSGIIGIGKEVRKSSYSCRICDMDSCIYRNTRQQ